MKQPNLKLTMFQIFLLDVYLLERKKKLLLWLIR